MTQLQTYHYTEWDTTFQLRALGKVEVLAIQDVCILLNSLSASETKHTHKSILNFIIYDYETYEGAIYMLYKEIGVIKFRIDHYAPLHNSDSLNNLYLNNIAIEQLIIDLCEMSDTQAEEQIGQIFEDSLSWI